MARSARPSDEKLKKTWWRTPMRWGLDLDGRARPWATYESCETELWLGP